MTSGLFLKCHPERSRGISFHSIYSRLRSPISCWPAAVGWIRMDDDAGYPCVPG